MSKAKRPKNRAELLPPAPHAPADMTGVIAKMVEQKVAEALANDSTAIFQPFMQSRQVSSEIRMKQTVPELEKWSYYFEECGAVWSVGNKTQGTRALECAQHASAEPANG